MTSESSSEYQFSAVGEHIYVDLRERDKGILENTYKIRMEPGLDIVPPQPPKYKPGLTQEERERATPSRLWRVHSSMALAAGLISESELRRINPTFCHSVFYNKSSQRDVDMLADLLQNKHLYLGSGIKYAVPWVAYTIHFNQAHSKYMVFPAGVRIPYREMIGLGRIGTSTKKLILLPYQSSSPRRRDDTSEQKEARAIATPAAEQSQQSCPPADATAGKRWKYVSLTRVNLVNRVASAQVSKLQSDTKRVRRTDILTVDEDF